MTYEIGDGVNFIFQGERVTGLVLEVREDISEVRIEFAWLTRVTHYQQQAVAGRILRAARLLSEVTKYEGPPLPTVQEMLLQQMRDAGSRAWPPADTSPVLLPEPTEGGGT